MHAPTEPRFAVVEGRQRERDTLRELIAMQPGWTVAHSAGDLFGLMPVLRTREISVAVVGEHARARGEGLPATIRKASGHAQILMRVAQIEESVVADYLHAGARGVVEETAPHHELLFALRRMLAGGWGLSTAAIEAIVPAYLRATSQERRPDWTLGSRDIEALTPRERQVYRLLGEGHSVKQIATRLFLSPKTIEYHRQRMKEKLRLPSSAALVRHATRNALLAPTKPDDLPGA